jgi:quinol monooxygenase YgiN
MQDRIVLVVRFRTKPGKQDLLLGHLDKLVQTMSAERHFVNAVVHRNVDRPDEIVVYETWLGTRETFLKDEFPRPYRKPYEQILPELVEDRSVDWLTPIGSQAVRHVDRGSSDEPR